MFLCFVLLTWAGWGWGGWTSKFTQVAKESLSTAAEATKVYAEATKNLINEMANENSPSGTYFIRNRKYTDFDRVTKCKTSLGATRRIKRKRNSREEANPLAF